LIRIGTLEELERAALLVGVEVPARRLPHEVDRVRQLLGGRQPAAPLERPGEEEEPDEDEVDQRRGGLEEVVVVRGDELAQLVDEEAEAHAAHNGGREARRAPEERDQQADRQHHEDPAVEQVRDVQPAAAELRVVGQPQLRADDEDGRDRGDEERLL
jgi:hypothetical protein